MCACAMMALPSLWRIRIDSTGNPMTKFWFWKYALSILSKVQASFDHFIWTYFVIRWNYYYRSTHKTAITNLKSFITFGNCMLNHSLCSNQETNRSNTSVHIPYKQFDIFKLKNVPCIKKTEYNRSVAKKCQKLFISEKWKIYFISRRKNRCFCCDHSIQLNLKWYKSIHQVSRNRIRSSHFKEETSNLPSQTWISLNRLHSL